MTFNPNFTGAGNVRSAQANLTSVQNNTGGTLIKGTPVRINGSGELDVIDVSIEAEVDGTIGVVFEDILDTNFGDIVSSGRVENITTTANVGDKVYISKIGILTNVKPEIGVGGFLSGDFVVKIGVIVKNIDTPANKDLVVGITTIGQL